MKAKYEGMCRNCKKPIQIGQEIRNSGGTWVHSVCAEKLDPYKGLSGEDQIYVATVTSAYSDMKRGLISEADMIDIERRADGW